MNEEMMNVAGEAAEKAAETVTKTGSGSVIGDIVKFGAGVVTGVVSAILGGKLIKRAKAGKNQSKDVEAAGNVEAGHVEIDFEDAE